MHYIRFLKPPRPDHGKLQVSVSTLITITTDLGDDFLAAEIPIYALLVRDGIESTESNQSVLATTKSTWRPGSRALQILISQLPSAAFGSALRLLISTTPEYTRPSQAQQAILGDLPSILHAWSAPFIVSRSPSEVFRNDTTSWVERRLIVSKTSTLRICEEMGESIARHVWDAGIVLAAFVRDTLLKLRFQDDEDTLFACKLQKPSGPNVIELGSGCGIVGLLLAQICPKASVLLTDLPQAMEVLEQNISIATLAPDSKVSKLVLDWDEDVPEALAQQRFDLVLVSDCTYNSDSIPALVRTLGLLVERSPEALVVIAMKVRHESEAVFHELIEEAGLHQCNHYAFRVPDRQRENTGQELDTVNIYMYQSKSNVVGENNASDIEP